MFMLTEVTASELSDLLLPHADLFGDGWRGKK